MCMTSHCGYFYILIIKHKMNDEFNIRITFWRPRKSSTFSRCLLSLILLLYCQVCVKCDMISGYVYIVNNFISYLFIIL